MTSRFNILVCVFLFGFSLPSPLEAQNDSGPGFGGGRGAQEGRGVQQGRGAQQGPGPQQGRGAQAGQDRRGPDDRHQADREVFHFLLQNHDKISRKVKELPNGVETLTESDTPQIAAKIKEHVEWMTYRIENSNPIRIRDPLFAEIFKHADKIEMVLVETEKGVRVVETSTDPYAAKLIKAHAKVVTGFVERGFAEAMKSHPVPAS